MRECFEKRKDQDKNKLSQKKGELNKINDLSIELLVNGAFRRGVCQNSLAMPATATNAIHKLLVAMIMLSKVNNCDC